MDRHGDRREFEEVPRYIVEQDLLLQTLSGWVGHSRDKDCSPKEYRCLIPHFILK